ncbi:MAG: DegT/DnrJ/EryC1/StrS aminotransferase family protein [Bacteroidales bacterium]|nr:DegT/DnrJ/EryC1/StrS aminotransferase family protein [Bacteroidales bacterium]MBR6227021.1 DegT/DnrJ/EryC1/StrS aminotransferase family protein [Bacteroidales bacterium]
MEPIGGYFELELRKGEHYHKDAIRLNTARNCFEYVLRTRNYKKVYVPYYTCEVMLEPIKKLGIGYEFYPINSSLEPVELSVLKEEEAFVYTNYYGLKQDCVKRLAKVYGTQLIVDNAQAFYAEPIQGIDTFYSARKFFGVSDGAYLYTGTRLKQDFEQDVSFNRMSHLLKRIDLGAESGFLDFRFNDDSLCGQGIKTMSRLTEAVLCGIDYESAKHKRRENYAFLDKALSDSNWIHLELNDEAVPMVYPYVTDDASLRSRLIEHKVFVATYWPNVNEWTNSELFEHDLAEKLIPIPCDQRYGKEHMERIKCIIGSVIE